MPVLTIPLTLKTDDRPTSKVLAFVRHALDSPWVESRVDVLTTAVSIEAGYFRPVICEDPPQLPKVAYTPH